METPSKDFNQLFRASNNGDKHEVERRCQTCGSLFNALIIRVPIGSQDKEFGGTFCPNCRKDKDNELEQREKAAESIRIAGKRRNWRETCGIPAKFLPEAFGTFDTKFQKVAYDIAFKFAQEFPVDKSSAGFRSLILFSRGFGVGKTHLACSIAHAILERSKCDEACPVYLISETAMLLRIRSTYDNGYLGDTEEFILRGLISRHLLIIDDVGKEKPRDRRFVERFYFNVIGGRYDAKLPVVVTSNLDLKGLSYHLGGAVVDRLVEMVGENVNIVDLTGPSYRRSLALSSFKPPASR